MVSQGFYVNKITFHCIDYSFVLLYLSEEENEPFDIHDPLHFKSAISWTGTIQGVKFRLKTNQQDVIKTVDELIMIEHKRMHSKMRYIEVIEETALKDYMLREVEAFIQKFVKGCKVSG
jgi:hypothetical protein